MEQRINFLDYLRVFATFFIIMIHVCSQNWNRKDIDVNSFAWQTFNFYDCISRWSVPVFVMISGALFLNKDIIISQIYRKNILRLVISFLVWSAFYCFLGNRTLSLKNILNGESHMWFIFMIIGLYMSSPIIREIVKNKNVMKYFLLLAFIFTFFIPFVNQIIHDFFKKTGTIYIINKKIQTMSMNLVLGYTGYFILGYYLNLITLTKKKTAIIYLGGILGLLLTVALQIILVLKTQQRTSNYYGYLTFNVLLSACAVFIWFKNSYFFSQSNAIIQKLSKYTFGVYLVHIFILNLLKNFGLNTMSFNPILSVLLITILVYFLSVCVVAILHCIPVLRKYIV
jgi:surface polysaccharide O-acyltransferase-like enzyme